MKCERLHRIGFQSPEDKGGIWSTACMRGGFRFKMQVMCSSRPGGGCHGYIWPPDSISVLGPIKGRNLRNTLLKLRSRLHRYEGVEG